MANPNPARITEPVWQCWLGCREAIPGVRYGGTYVKKRCYHGSRADNQRSWPDAYCIKLSLDLQGPSDKTAAIDLTMSDSEMRKRTGYLRSAANARDPRLGAVREFYGTLDSRSVYGRSKNSKTGSWRSSSADSSHLWHIHISFFRAYVTSWAELAPVVSVLSGESLAAWRARTGGASLPSTGLVPEPTLREGDFGPRVGHLQRSLNEALGLNLTVDDDFGPATATAVRELQRLAGITQDEIYGPESARALTALLEDDMSWDEKIKTIRNQGVGYSDSEWPARFMLSSNHFYTLKYGQAMLAEQAAARKREEAILAKLSGADTKTILAAIQKAALEDAARDTAAADALAEIAALVAKVGSGQLAADAFVDEVAKRLSPAGGE